MTTNYTLFVDMYASAFADTVQVADPAYAEWSAEMAQQVRYNVQRRNQQTLVLAANATQALTFSGGVQLAEWHVLVVRCIGQGQIITTGKDTDGATSITGTQGIYGTAVLPGIFILSTYNLTGVTLKSLAAGTVFEVLECFCVEDGQ